MKYFINIKDFFYYNRKKILGGIILLLVCVSFFAFKDEKVEEDNFLNDSNSYLDDFTNNDTDKEENKYFVVDVKGAVLNPNTYKVLEDMRIVDVIELAGGLLDDADVSQINLSKKVVDEMIINIPFKSDKKEENAPYLENNEVANYESNNTKVSINYGSLEDLTTIKGIGITKAKAIIEYRNSNGFFKSIEEIVNVKGIGSSTFEKIKDYITL